MQHFELFINGKHVKPISGEYSHDIDPATQKSRLRRLPQAARLMWMLRLGRPGLHRRAGPACGLLIVAAFCSAPRI